jgi:hypothetical protein
LGVLGSTMLAIKRSVAAARKACAASTMRLAQALLISLAGFEL